MAKGKKSFTMTPAHDKFCQHYAEYGNATQAYLYAWPNVKYDSAKAHGYELLQNVAIAQRIEQLKEEFRVQYNQTKDATIRDLINSAEEAKKAFQFSAYAKLREMVIKMCGFYEPEKYEHKISFDLEIPGAENDKYTDEQESEDNKN